ncbi:MAG: GyrI-like domain-containing protein [Pseudomonadota bacterium]
MNIKRKTLPEQHYLYVDREADFNGPAIAQAMGAGFGELMGFIQKHSIERQGMPATMYFDMPSGPRLSFRCAMFVSEHDAAHADESIRADVIPAGDVVCGTHVGPYASLSDSHRALWSYCDEHGLTKAMPVWEHYIDDPGVVAEEQLRTEVYRRIESA